MYRCDEGSRVDLIILARCELMIRLLIGIW